MDAYELAEKFRSGKWAARDLQAWNDLSWSGKLIFALLTRFPFLRALRRR